MVRVTCAAAYLTLCWTLVVPQLRAQGGTGTRSGVPAVTPVPAELPLKHAPQATAPEISAADLMTRLYIFADDSMQGRELGTPGNFRGTTYIAGEMKKIGLEPAGDGGTFFQNFPMWERQIDRNASLVAEGAPLTLWSDFAPLPTVAFLPFGSTLVSDSVRVIYGGRVGDTLLAITPAQAAGKLVVLSAPRGDDGNGSFQFWLNGDLPRYRRAAGVAVIALDLFPPPLLAALREPTTVIGEENRAEKTGPVGLVISERAAAALLGTPVGSVKPGTPGRVARASLRSVLVPPSTPSRNVVAILRGSDPRLSGEYVAIGAHNDHVGIADEPEEHDSLRAFNHVMRPRGVEDEPGTPSAQQSAEIRALLDSLRRLHPPRLDSIYNGADDDGSGSVSVLEIAEAFASARVKPRRSLLFVWHVGEEEGMYGSRYFTDHPTVPRDSIVAQLNIDMVGRGDAGDISHGGPGYLQLIGSRRLSTELGDIVERVNREQHHGFTFDYQFDANGSPEQYYCRSDHYMYARWGIPIVFFSTGGHQDYHELTDEPQYIDYPHMQRVATLIHDIAETVANLDHRVRVDHAKPDPQGQCVQ